MRGSRATLSAALLPCAAWGLAAMSGGHSPVALASNPRLLAIVASDALVAEAILATLAVPLAAVAVSKQAGGTRAAIGPVFRLVAAAIAASIAIAAVAWQRGGLEPQVLLRGQATLAAVCLALAAAGLAASAWLRDALDAAAAAVVVAAVAAAGLLVAGPAVADLPQATIDAALLASPVVATASSAGIDLVRSDIIYRLSPVAHRRFEYPAWHVAALAYLAAAGVLAGAALLRGDSA